MQPIKPSKTEGTSLTVLEIEQWLLLRIKEVTRSQLSSIDPLRPLEEYGLDSLQAISLAGELEELLQITVPDQVLQTNRTLRELAQSLASMTERKTENDLTWD